MLDEKDPVVWGGYTQAELDAQYNQMSVVSEAEREEHRRFKTEESARVRSKLAKTAILDAAYGSSAAERLDIFRPKTAAEHKAAVPVQIYFHGGAWKGGSKSDVSFIAEPFVARDAIFVAVGYAPVPVVTLDEHVRQAQAAVAWVHTHAADFGGDSNRIYISGHSSGGHVCAMVAVTDWPKAFGLPPDLIKGASPVSGMYDLEPVRLSWRNSYLSLDRTAAERLSPIRYIPDRRLPLVVGYGSEELDEFKRQSRDFAIAWRKRGHTCLEVELVGRKHFAVGHAFANEQGALAKAIFAQMNI